LPIFFIGDFIHEINELGIQLLNTPLLIDDSQGVALTNPLYWYHIIIGTPTKQPVTHGMGKDHLHDSKLILWIQPIQPQVGDPSNTVFRLGLCVTLTIHYWQGRLFLGCSILMIHDQKPCFFFPIFSGRLESKYAQIPLIMISSFVKSFEERA
jgi:hypothetical protein